MLRIYLAPVRVASPRKHRAPNAENAGKKELSFTTGGNVNYSIHYGNWYGLGSQKPKNRTPT
jgi:hypothetical protein